MSPGYHNNRGTKRLASLGRQRTRQKIHGSGTMEGDVRRNEKSDAFWGEGLHVDRTEESVCDERPDHVVSHNDIAGTTFGNRSRDDLEYVCNL
jgi:hypothetical protein